ncbi:hypothetical protein OsccyDRAFT_3759 [Leptolyngbyaceae cyanobacterium JSC-12]|nr:hypothetical protein OsccyDRAFT_3759 [Leptolyngbyaceae cyanobacterium JSC-12]
MVSQASTMSQPDSPSVPFPVLNGKSVKNCHIILPNDPKPTSAVWYGNRFYGFVRAYADLGAAHRAAERLMARGNAVILTQVRRGLVLWVFEPDAQLARTSRR